MFAHTLPSHWAGWGGPGGYVYQKAYLEFFCSKDKLDLLVEKCKALPSVTYIAVNKEGQCVSNVGPTAVNAVTWGVFPAKEIIQPTVVDPASFMIWKDEAFEIWTRGWARLFPEGDPSRELLELVIDTSPVPTHMMIAYIVLHVAYIILYALKLQELCHGNAACCSMYAFCSLAWEFLR